MLKGLYKFEGARQLRCQGFDTFLHTLIATAALSISTLNPRNHDTIFSAWKANNSTAIDFFFL